MKKTNKGITLIVLVITIVVLLILAAITINTVLGKNGIIARSKDAREKTEIGEEKEIVQFAIAEAKLFDSNGKLTFKNFEEAMANNARNKKYTLTDEGDNIKITFASGREYYAEEENSESGNGTYFVWELNDTEAKIVGLKDEAKELEEIKVPDTYNDLPVTTLNADFTDAKVKNIFIGKNITNISTHNFVSSGMNNLKLSEKLESIKVSKNNTKYADIDGVLVGKDGKYLIQYPFNKSGDEYTIPDSVETIGSFSFAHTKVKKINFNKAKYITNSNAFQKSEMAKQKSITIPKDLSCKEIVTALLSAITDAGITENIIVENGNANFKSIDGVLFNSKGTILYYYPTNRPGNNYIIPDSTKVIESRAFWHGKTTAIKNLTFGENLKGIRKNAFWGNDIENIYMNDKIYYIGEKAFYYGTKLQTINNIPRNLQIIEDNVFYKTNLDEDTIKIITKINPNALYEVTTSGYADIINYYDYDMECEPITNTFNENDSEYDVYIPSPKVGDYVNYIYDKKELAVYPNYAGGTETQYITNTTGLSWSILNVDNVNEKVEIISSRPANEKLSLYGSEGFTNGVYILNNMCNYLYRNSKYSSTARSLNIKDIESCYNQAGIDKRNSYVSEGNIQYGNTIKYGYMSYPGLYAQQKGNGVTSNNLFAPKLTIKNPDPYEESDPINSKIEKSSYEYIYDGTVTQTAYKLPINYQYFYDKVYQFGSSIPYFIASRCVDTTQDIPKYGIRCVSSSVDFLNICDDSSMCGIDYENIATATIRPVVTLDMNLLKSKDRNNAWNLEYKDAGSSGEYLNGPFEAYDDCAYDYCN